MVVWWEKLLTTIVRSLPPLVVSLMPGQQRALVKLKNMREELSNEVTDIINDFGPKLYSDFDKVGFPYFVPEGTGLTCQPAPHPRTLKRTTPIQRARSLATQGRQGRPGCARLRPHAPYDLD